MPWNHKVTIRPNDRLFSSYIKARDKGRCVYNFRCFVGTPGTDCSHFQKRRKETTRYDPDNCDLSCRKCHWFIENDPKGQETLEEWKENQLGAQGYKALLVRANTIGKRDDFLTKIHLKELMKTL